MRLRPRPDPETSDAAARVLGLLAPPASGWVPPVTPPAGEPAAREVAAGESAAGEVAAGEVASGESAAGEVPLGDSDPSRETAAARLPPALPSGRWDPGRRGAVALVVAALFAAVVAAGVVLRGRPQEIAVPQVAVPGVVAGPEVAVPEVVASGAPLPGTTRQGTSPTAAPATEVVVAVAGKVVRPGLVRLPTGSRVDDAVRAAGGVLPGADAGMLNLARPLVDGEQVLVGVDPPPGAASPGAAPPGAAPTGALPGSAGSLVDLNAATPADLDALPGIGPVLAQRIVDWRTEHGRFDSVEQLREVTGIGESKYADLEAKVTV